MDKILWRFWYLCLVLPNIKLKGDIDGVEAAEQIHTHLDVPVIYLTAHADEDTLQRAKITEPYGYILKPFQARELHPNIEIALHKHKMEKKLRENERWLATILRSIGLGTGIGLHSIANFVQASDGQTCALIKESSRYV